ncbi:aldehyde dehydrogenase family protein [Paraburkholderia rhynchosiae]|uniref:NAD/NADP-dependent betaine aldehyde dehydrogenase n=1 Tax=Paraburkholderia rhynchosiae TaxID=487049 RepID=A0A6J5CMW6_9BURK|nr:NAD/NADP-dependent betaine aldehyde dehydrogenase [Paraburkholderia rhynchosiae]
MILLAVISAAFGFAVCVYLQQPVFGKLPDNGSLSRIEHSPNYANGSFHNQIDTPLHTGGSSEQHAVQLGNSVIYGLVAGVWTGNIGRRARRMTHALKAGTVWVNTYRAYSFMMPFGGMKMSGLGRENRIEALNDRGKWGLPACEENATRRAPLQSAR